MRGSGFSVWMLGSGRTWWHKGLTPDAPVVKLGTLLTLSALKVQALCLPEARTDTSTSSLVVATGQVLRST